MHIFCLLVPMALILRLHCSLLFCIEAFEDVILENNVVKISRNRLAVSWLTGAAKVRVLRLTNLIRIEDMMSYLPI